MSISLFSNVAGASKFLLISHHLVCGAFGFIGSNLKPFLGCCFRLDDSFQNFERYRNSLMLNCEEGDAGILEVTPNITWPDVVYYQVRHEGLEVRIRWFQPGGHKKSYFLI